jgi:hypothetical protein
MAREFKETAHTKTDMQKYGENYDHIFNKIEACGSCGGDHYFENEDTGEFDIECEDCVGPISQSENNPEPRVICEEFGPCDL